MQTPIKNHLSFTNRCYSWGKKENNKWQKQNWESQRCEVNVCCLLTVNLMRQIHKVLKEAEDVLSIGEVGLTEQTFHQLGSSQYTKRERQEGEAA